MKGVVHSIMKKPNLVVDVDGVILNFSRPFSKWYNNVHMQFQRHDDDGVFHENPHVWHFDARLKESDLHHAVDEFMKTNPVLPLLESNIPTVLDELSETYEVHILTACPVKWSENRMRNLSHWGIKSDSIQFCESDRKHIYIDQLDPIAVIEDRPATLKVLFNKGHNVIFPSFWNYLNDFPDVLHQQKEEEAEKSYGEVHSYLSWEEIPSILEQLNKE